VAGAAVLERGTALRAVVSEICSLCNSGPPRDARSLKDQVSGRAPCAGPATGREPMTELLGVGIFVAAAMLLMALASRRQRLHGGSMRPEHGRLGQNEKPPEGWWWNGWRARSHNRGRW
jgi:hypothetical protein